MSLEVTSFAELDPELVGQLRDTLAQIIKEQYPQVEVRTGVIGQLVLYLAGVCAAVNRTENTRVLGSNSLLDISANPALADDELVDQVLSNFRTFRKQGKLATGDITMAVTGNVTVVIPAGDTYSASGVDFVVSQPFTIKPAGDTALSATERVLTPLGSDAYAFTVPATATATGVAGNIRRGTALTPAVPTSRFLYAVAAADFTGGTDVETNADLIARLERGIAAPVMQGRTNILAAILADPAFEDTLHYSIIGHGMAEMTRDQHGIVPISTGGRVDIYARTAPTAEDVSITKTATLIERAPDGDIWQVSLTKDDMAGVYEIASVFAEDDAAGAAGMIPTEDHRGFDVDAEDETVPDIADAVEAAYSRFQTAVIRFADTTTQAQALAVGATATYRVVARRLPLIAELQEFCSDLGRTDLAGDVLVKAAVPCFLTVRCDVEYAPDTTPPELATLQNSVAEAVNAVGFTGKLHASVIVEAIAQHLTAKQAVRNLFLRGRIRRADGETVYLKGTDILEVPNAPSVLLSPRTVIFLADPADMGISLVQQSFGEVY